MNFRPMLRTEKNDSVLWINFIFSDDDDVCFCRLFNLFIYYGFSNHFQLLMLFSLLLGYAFMMLSNI